MAEMQARHRALAERHIVEGEQRVAQQEARIEQLARDRHDTTSARAFLETLNDALTLMRSHLQMILDEIASEAV